MPRTRVVLFRDADGVVPVLEWFDRLPEKAQDKCLARIERLRESGYELRRPEADYLRDGIHELRVRCAGVNYRMLDFFHGRTAVVVHGFDKQTSEVPRASIDKARERWAEFALDPGRHTFEE